MGMWWEVSEQLGLTSRWFDADHSADTDHRGDENNQKEQSPVQRSEHSTEIVQVPEAPKTSETPYSLDQMGGMSRKELTARYDMSLPNIEMSWADADHVLVNGERFAVVEDEMKTFAGKWYTSLDGNGTVWDMYFGDFVDGKPEGRWKILYRDGSVYVGEIKEGKPHGNGMLHKIILTPSLENPQELVMHEYEYVWGFVDGKREGDAGYYRWPNGSTLLCTRKNDRPAATTRGKMTYAGSTAHNTNGGTPVAGNDSYEGMLATVTDPDNAKKWQISRTGEWTYTYADGRKVTGTRADGELVEEKI